MYIKYSAKATDNFLSKYTFNKQMIDWFSFVLAETASIGATPSLLNQIIPRINFFFYCQPNKAFYFLGNAKVPNLSIDVVMSQGNICWYNEIICSSCCNHTIFLIIHPEKGVFIIYYLNAPKCEAFYKISSLLGPYTPKV